MDTRKIKPSKEFEAELRAEFERQHAGRDLVRHRLRGTYRAANIAALWNQHVRTAMWLVRRHNRIGEYCEQRQQDQGQP